MFSWPITKELREQFSAFCPCKQWGEGCGERNIMSSYVFFCSTKWKREHMQVVYRSVCVLVFLGGTIENLKASHSILNNCIVVVVLVCLDCGNTFWNLAKCSNLKLWRNAFMILGNLWPVHDENIVWFRRNFNCYSKDIVCIHWMRSAHPACDEHECIIFYVVNIGENFSRRGGGAGLTSILHM